MTSENDTEFPTPRTWAVLSLLTGLVLVSALLLLGIAPDTLKVGIAEFKVEEGPEDRLLGAGVAASLGVLAVYLFLCWRDHTSQQRREEKAARDAANARAEETEESTGLGTVYDPDRDASRVPRSRGRLALFMAVPTCAVLVVAALAVGELT